MTIQVLLLGKTNETVQLGVTVENTANNAVTWNSSNSSVATVSPTGLVTPMSVGTVTITATSQADTTRASAATIEVRRDLLAFGTGRDGNLTVGSGQWFYPDNIRAAVTGEVSAGTLQVNLLAPTTGQIYRRRNQERKLDWVDSGLFVAIGDQLQVVKDPNGHDDIRKICYGADGSLCYDGNGTNDLAPAGWTAPGLRKFSLVAKINNGTPFYVGDSFTGIMNANGPLAFGINDCSGCQSDNSYQNNSVQFPYFVTITRTAQNNFANGDEVLIIQMTGEGVGNHEFARVSTANPSSLVFTQPLKNRYITSGNSRAQVIRVPNYENVTVQTGGVIHGRMWDGSTGGVVVLKARQKIEVQTSGWITAAHLGFVGGVALPWQQPTTPPGYRGMTYDGSASVLYQSGYGGAGGGGNNTGGGGGGYGTLGQTAPADWVNAPVGVGGGIYGWDGSLLLGSGGGGTSHALESSAGGGAGGGIALVVAQNVVNNGFIISTGQGGGQGCYTTSYYPTPAMQSTRNGGAGSGGSVSVKVFEFSGSGTILVNGGIGGISNDGWGKGGDGGLGRARLEYCASDTFSGTRNPISVAKICQ